MLQSFGGVTGATASPAGPPRREPVTPRRSEGYSVVNVHTNWAKSKYFELERCTCEGHWHFAAGAIYVWAARLRPLDLK